MISVNNQFFGFNVDIAGVHEEECEMSTKRIFEEGDCDVTNEQANAILCADEYSVHVEKYGCQQVPNRLPNKCYGGSLKRRRINCSNAVGIIRQWQADGIPDRAKSYLFWNYPQISEFLQHRNISISADVQTKESSIAISAPSSPDSSLSETASVDDLLDGEDEEISATDNEQSDLDLSSEAEEQDHNERVDESLNGKARNLHF